MCACVLAYHQIALCHLVIRYDWWIHHSLARSRYSHDLIPTLYYIYPDDIRLYVITAEFSGFWSVSGFICHTRSSSQSRSARATEARTNAIHSFLYIHSLSMVWLESQVCVVGSGLWVRRSLTPLKAYAEYLLLFRDFQMHNWSYRVCTFGTKVWLLLMVRDFSLSRFGITQPNMGLTLYQDYLLSDRPSILG